MHNSKTVLLVIILLTAAAAVIDIPKTLKIRNFTINRPNLAVSVGPIQFSRDLNIREGLDLAGGTSLTLSADMSKINPADRDRALSALQSVIERRVNFYGVSEPVIQTAKVGNDYRIIVELAGVKDTNEAINLIGTTANLTFREAVDASQEAKISTEAARLYGPYQIVTNLTGSDLARADPGFNQQTGEPIINLQFTDAGAKKFEDITRRNLNKQVAIFLDNELLMAPTVQSVITGGQAYISGKFTPEQTKNYALLLNSGALPAPVKIVQQQTIGATLGTDSVRESLVAGLIGLTIVALFMLVNYGQLGLLADLALIIYTLLVLAIFKILPVTLTLAGIAGFILSIGMAVDANILIFERTKEERRWGKSPKAAIELGFLRAFPSIRDSNVSSLITCGILYWFGTGAVRGFALTLAIGILISLFTAITVTRTFLRIFDAN